MFSSDALVESVGDAHEAAVVFTLTVCVSDRALDKLASSFLSELTHVVFGCGTVEVAGIFVEGQAMSHVFSVQDVNLLYCWSCLLWSCLCWWLFCWAADGYMI